MRIDEITGLREVNYSQVKNRGTTLVDHPTDVRDENGNTPDYLFRYVEPSELQDIISSGFVKPSKFYRRIHASIAPEKSYMSMGGPLIAIKFRERDGWKPKMSSNGVYATTYEDIPVSMVYLVRI